MCIATAYLFMPCMRLRLRVHVYGYGVVGNTAKRAKTGSAKGNGGGGRVRTMCSFCGVVAFTGREVCVCSWSRWSIYLIVYLCVNYLDTYTCKPAFCF